jgi:hypothetical protein
VNTEPAALKKKANRKGPFAKFRPDRADSVLVVKAGEMGPSLERHLHQPRTFLPIDQRGSRFELCALALDPVVELFLEDSLRG